MAGLVTGVLLLVVFGIVVWGAYVFLRLLVASTSEKELYQEGASGYWKFAPVKCSMRVVTPSGFRATVELTATLERIDDQNFKVMRMLRDENQMSVLRMYFTNYVRPILKVDLGDWLVRDKEYYFVQYVWYGDSVPGVTICRFGPSLTAEATVNHDPNGMRLRDASKQRSPSPSSPMYGCNLELHGIRAVVVDDLVKQSHDMISDNDHKNAEELAVYQRYVEASVVKALKLRLDLAQQSKPWPGDAVTVTSSVVGCTVELSWQLNKNCFPGSRLLGFRKENGFEIVETFNKTRNGIPIIDSDRDGAASDRPTPGSTYYYTFFLCPPPTATNPSPTPYSLVRFEIAVPVENDLARLKKMLEEAQRVTRKSDPDGSRIDAKIALAKHNLALEERLLRFEQRMTEEINASNLTTSGKASLTFALSEQISTVRNEMLEQ